MATIIDIFENLLGEELTPRILPVGSRLSRRQLEDLVEALTLFDDGPWTLPTASDSWAASLVPRAIGYPELRDIGVPKYIRSLQSRLLYYPRVHVLHHLNPIFLLSTPDSLTKLDEFLRVYIHLREIIQRGYLVVSTWPSVELTDPEIDALNESDSKDDALIEFTRSLHPFSYYPTLDDPLQIIDEYNITQVVAANVDTSWTAKYSELSRIHEYKLRRMQAEFSSLDGIEVSAIDFFGRLELPSLSTLDVEDFVSVRLQEDAFEEWRSMLVSVLSAMPTGSLHSDNVNREFTQRARAMMTPVLGRIRDREVSKSIRQHLRDSAIGFAAGASSIVVESMTIAATNPKEGLIKLGASTATALLASVIFRRPKRSTAALRKFYSLFEDEAALE